MTPSASQAYHAHYAPFQNARRYTTTHGPTHQYQVQQKALNYPQSTVHGGSCVAMIDNRYQALNGQERDNRGHDGHKLAYSNQENGTLIKKMIINILLQLKIEKDMVYKKININYNNHHYSINNHGEEQ